MKINKLDRYETKTAPEPSPESIRADREIVINMLMAIAEKMKKNPAPVADSFESLAQQAKTGVIRQPTIIQSGESEKPADDTKKSTFIDTGNDTKNATLFDSEDLAILEKLNAEIS